MGNSQGNLTPAQVTKWRDMGLVKQRLEKDVAEKDVKIAALTRQLKYSVEDKPVHNQTILKLQIELEESKKTIEENKLSHYWKIEALELRSMVLVNESLEKDVAEKENTISVLTRKLEHSLRRIEDEPVHNKTILKLQKELKQSTKIIEENKLIHYGKTTALQAELRSMVLVNERLEKDVAMKNAEIEIQVADSLRLSQLVVRQKEELKWPIADNKKTMAQEKINKQTIQTLRNQLVESQRITRSIQSKKQKAINVLTEKHKKLSCDLTKASDDLAQEKKQCSNQTEQINELEQKQKTFASIQNGLNAKVNQQEEEIVSKVKKLDELRLENESLTSQYEMIIDGSNEGDKVDVELVGVLFKLYKVKKDELNKAETRTNPTDEVKQEQKCTEKTTEPNQQVLQKLDEIFECNICCVEQATSNRVVFNKCGHGACNDCANQLIICHMCREPILSKIKQF